MEHNMNECGMCDRHTVVGQRFAGNGPNGLSYYYYYPQTFIAYNSKTSTNFDNHLWENFRNTSGKTFENFRKLSKL